MSVFTTSDGLRLHYTDSGIASGQPLLCLAGLTRNGSDFSFLAPHASDLRLLTLDARGRGGSQYDDDFMNYNVLRESQDVIELLDHLGLDKVTLLGTSRGGVVSMALAASHIDRLSGVILNDVGPVIDPQGIARIMDYVGKKPAARTLDEAAAVTHRAMADQFPGVPLRVWRQQVEGQYNATQDGLDLRYDVKLRDALLEQAAKGAPPDLWMVFDALKPRPLGIIRGANSDVLGRETLGEMLRRRPDAIWREVADRGHVPFLDEAPALQVIRAVLDRAA